MHLFASFLTLICTALTLFYNYEASEWIGSGAVRKMPPNVETGVKPEPRF
jgi:hypothetical protein